MKSTTFRNVWLLATLIILRLKILNIGRIAATFDLVTTEYKLTVFFFEFRNRTGASEMKWSLVNVYFG